MTPPIGIGGPGGGGVFTNVDAASNDPNATPAPGTGPRARLAAAERLESEREHGHHQVHHHHLHMLMASQKSAPRQRSSSRGTKSHPDEEAEHMSAGEEIEHFGEAHLPESMRTGRAGGGQNQVKQKVQASQDKGGAGNNGMKPTVRIPPRRHVGSQMQEPQELAPMLRNVRAQFQAGQISAKRLIKDVKDILLSHPELYAAWLDGGGKATRESRCVILPLKILREGRIPKGRKANLALDLRAFLMRSRPV